MNAKQLHSWIKDIPKANHVSRTSLIAMLRQASCLVTDLENKNERLHEALAIATDYVKHESTRTSIGQLYDIEQALKGQQ